LVPTVLEGSSRLMDSERQSDRTPLRSSLDHRFWITCYADGSFRPEGAGWAVWLRSVKGRVVRQGPCPPYVKRSLEAELAAIFAGLIIARRTWGDAVRGAIIRTDCLEAINLLSTFEMRDRVRRRWPGTLVLCTKIRELVVAHGVELDLRWVKGHQRTNSVQAYLNNACDKRAGEAAKRGAAAVRGWARE
jgi:ribonuclease HI